MVDTTANRALSSLLFDSIAQELADAYTELNQAQVEQGISDPTTASTEGMADLAYNWNLTSRGAVASTGVITFQRTEAPTMTIPIGAQDGSGGITVSTSRQASGTVVSFSTTETVYFTTATTVNPVTGYYEVDTAITCQITGTVGNVDAGLIDTLQSAVAGVDFVTNKISTTGGRAEEDNTTLANRIAKKVQGLQPGVENGLVSIAMAEDNVIDAVVCGPNDTEFVHDVNLGKVDLILLGDKITPITQLSTYVTGQTTIPFTNRPVTSVSSVSAMVGLTQTALISGADYTFTQDLTGTNARSNASTDMLSWLGGSLPNNGVQVELHYNYDKVVNDIQTIVDGNDKHFITADVVVKRASQVTIDVTLTVRKVLGYDNQTVTAQVASAISNYINNLGLGQVAQQSDMILAIEAEDSVDSVSIPLTKFAIRGSSGVSDITPTKYQYLRVDSQSITTTVS